MSEEYTEQETEVFEYLDALRESGVTNMYGAGVYIERDFGMEREEAKALSGQVDGDLFSKASPGGLDA